VGQRQPLHAARIQGPPRAAPPSAGAETERHAPEGERPGRGAAPVRVGGPRDQLAGEAAVGAGAGEERRPDLEPDRAARRAEVRARSAVHESWKVPTAPVNPAGAPGGSGRTRTGISRLRSTRWRPPPRKASGLSSSSITSAFASPMVASPTDSG